jgi:aspartate/methionine/tyrosine aminotransferase
MTWAKHHAPARFDLAGSNLLPLTVEELPGAREALELWAVNDDGYPPLLEAIAERYGVDTSHVATAAGAAGANFLALAALVRPGDEVVVEWPGYDPQAGAARFLGAEVRTFARTWEEGFVVNPDRIAEAITARTRVVVLTNLHNPTGVYTPSSVLSEVGRIAESVGAKVLVDEVYLEVLTGADTRPAHSLGDTFLSVNSLTKSFGLSGLRVGWILADPPMVEAARRVRDVVDGIGATPSETLAVLAFQELDRLLERARSIVEPNGALLASFVARRPELEWIPPAGGSVGFPRVKDVDDASPLVNLAHQEYGVGLAPGSFFGCPDHFRVAVSGAPEVLEGGLEALDRALDGFRAEL